MHYIQLRIGHETQGWRLCIVLFFFFFFQAEDGIRDVERSRGLGDVYKRQAQLSSIVRPCSLKGERQMCEHIIKRFKEEDEEKEQEKIWLAENRQTLLELMSARRETNKLLETKAGIKKPFLERPQTCICTNQGKKYTPSESEIIHKLKQPKKEFKPNNLFLHGEFRGMLIADHQDVLDQLAPKNKSEIRPSTVSLLSPRDQIGLRKTRRGFPVSIHSSSGSLISPCASSLRSFSIRSPQSASSKRTIFTERPSATHQSVTQSSPLEDPEAIQYQKEIKQHDLRCLGMRKKTVGFSRVMLQETLNYETIAQERFQLDRLAHRSSQFQV
eukprot:TRINITY_DN4932_c0_g1_i3.p1 TRINITY_DN4932_c0_g1~~TRINITY_DN4932_c0_g1_i3.p1  ORF type:complete len:328 (-),score=41.29 TRINITY_DN4932_c0_g1_i3:228-1211(-)